MILLLTIVGTLLALCVLGLTTHHALVNLHYFFLRMRAEPGSRGWRARTFGVREH